MRPMNGKGLFSAWLALLSPLPELHKAQLSPAQGYSKSNMGLSLKQGTNGFGLGEMSKVLKWRFRAMAKHSWQEKHKQTQSKTAPTNIWENGWPVAEVNKAHKKLCTYYDYSYTNKPKYIRKKERYIHIKILMGSCQRGGVMADLTFISQFFTFSIVWLYY